MSIPSVKQEIERCPHHCGASINYAEKGNQKNYGWGWMTYHKCKQCGKTYSVRNVKK